MYAKTDSMETLVQAEPLGGCLGRQFSRPFVPEGDAFARAVAEADAGPLGGRDRAAGARTGRDPERRGREVPEQRRLAADLLLDEDAAHAQRAACPYILQRVLEHDRGMRRGADGVEHRPKRRGFGLARRHHVLDAEDEVVAKELAQAQ